MPAAIRKSSLLGPNGQPVSYFLYPTPRFNLRQYKPRYWLSADTKSNVSEYDRWELVNYSRQLYAQVNELSTAIDQKNSWAFGDAWDPHYLGKNKKWGEEATEFLRLQFYQMCNVRGPEYDFKRSLWISGVMWDVDGDDAMVLTESPSGFPQLAFFPSTRVGMQAARGGSTANTRGDGPNATVEGGPFDGAKIFDGVIYDRNLRMIGLRITSEDGEVTDIPSYSCQLAYEPKWHDQGRGIARVATGLLKWMNMQDIDEFLQRGMKRAASIGLKFKSEDGQGAVGNEVVTSEDDPNPPAGSDLTAGDGPAGPKIYYEEVEGGEMYYLNSSTGEEIEGLDYKNPHPNSEKFVERIIRGSLASVGWLYELLNLSSTGRAPSRLACDIGNVSISDRQSTGYRRWRRAIIWAIAKGMKNGFISRNDDGIDPYLWEPGYPKPLSVDAGNDEQADRENLKLGTISKSLIAQKKGHHYKDIERQREEEIRDLIASARAISKDNPEVPFEKVLELLEQRTPNGSPMPPRPNSPGATGGNGGQQNR